MKKPIRTENENEKALERIYFLIQKHRRSITESDELELLSILVEDFEKKTYPIQAPDPIAAIKVRMEQMQLTRNDLADITGHHSRVSEIFSGKRQLTIGMIKSLRERLNISADILISREPEIKYKVRRKKKVHAN
ncbi:MAG: helix-turn-helix domain-containing protein [Chitinophagales bacterium]